MEAFFLTGIIRFSILFVAFSKIAKLSGKYNEESSDSLCDEQIFIGNRVGYAVCLVSKHTPWQSKCLVKALTIQIMLDRRKVSSTLYLGVRKDEHKKLLAHAWLRCGAKTICGGVESKCFTQVAKFASCDRVEKC